MPNVIFSVRDIKITKETKDYIKEKLAKLLPFTEAASHISVNIVEIKSHVGEFKDISVEVLIKLPKAFVKVEETGNNVNKIIDKILPVLHRRLKRYNSHKDRWHETAKWKTLRIKKAIVVDEPESGAIPTDYAPSIKRKTLTDNTPMHPAEAIERMELIGHSSFLFKNIESNTYAMIYRRDKGGYGLVEPKL